jgi:hypothetical protein
MLPGAGEYTDIVFMEGAELDKVCSQQLASLVRAPVKRESMLNRWTVFQSISWSLTGAAESAHRALRAAGRG